MFAEENIAQQRFSSCALVFYQVQADEPSKINRIAAWCTGTAGMSHAELRFRDGRSLSVFQDETVFLKKRGYSNRQYRIMSISIPKENEKQMIRFAENQVGKKFNKVGLWLGVLPWFMRRRTDGHKPNGKWFCSELVCATLRVGGFMTDTQPNAATPNGLYEMCKHSANGRYGCTKNAAKVGLNAAISTNTLAMVERTTEMQFGKTKFTPKRGVFNTSSGNNWRQYCDEEAKPLLLPAGMGAAIKPKSLDSL